MNTYIEGIRPLILAPRMENLCIENFQIAGGKMFTKLKEKNERL